MFLAAASSLSATMSIDPDLTNFRPGSDAYTELQMLATIFSALACGVVLSLSVSCFQLVWFHKKTDSASKSMHRFLLAYITFMTCTSVVYLALDIASTRNSIFTDGPHVDLFLPAGSRAICVAFASWGADGFMVRILATIWSLLLPINPTDLETRAALRRSIRTSKSLVHWPSRSSFVFVFRWACYIMFLKHKFTSLLPAVGILMIIASLTIQENEIAIVAGYKPELFSFAGLSSITVLGNVIFATLITVRLLSHQRQISKLLGKAFGSPYTRTISICVESCALITVVYFVFLILLSLKYYAFQIPRGLVVHASVSVSPLILPATKLTLISIGDLAHPHHQAGGRGKRCRCAGRGHIQHLDVR